MCRGQEEIDKYRQGYEIERIVDVRESGATNELEYLVQWKGFPLLEDTDSQVGAREQAG